jgi:two-component system, cell cycle sensor histidine kinase and response regulator CckA
LHAAFGFPILLGGEVLGVLEFFSHEILEPDDDMLQAAATIGSQIGQFIKRSRAEDALRQREEQLGHSQKMEAIGLLAGGVAHEFNNLLTIIIGQCDLLLLKQQGDKKQWSAKVEEIRRAGKRAASLTSQLLAFSRKQILQLTVLNLNDVVSDVEKMLRPLIGEGIEMAAELDPRCGEIKADRGQIEQVLVNLIVNARDAMRGQGKLTLKTSNVELDEEYVGTHIATLPGRYVLLTISDTGEGMNAETQERIFEPFFTTKEPGKGTGLGLSMVYGIVKQLGGNIWVYSEPGHGTVFKIYLPRVDEEPADAPPAASERALPRGMEAILLVEDEEMVRRLAREILESQGYKVMEAQDSNDAISICQREKGPIHLLLTDVVMPQMGGRELASSLVHLHPEIRVLFMSGYAEGAIAPSEFMEEGMTFIQKPFTPSDLIRKVRALLDAPGQE